MSAMNSVLIEQVLDLETVHNVILLDGRKVESPCARCNGAGYRVPEGLTAVICDVCQGQRSEA